MAFVGECLKTDPTPTPQMLLPLIEEKFAKRVHLRSLQRAMARGKKNA